MATILCPHCGTANRAGSNFCNRCGASLRSEQVPPPAPPPTPGDKAPDPATGEWPQEGERLAQPATGGPQPEPPVGSGPAPGDEQPWLQPGFAGEDDVPPEPPEVFAENVDAGVADTTDIPTATGRLVSGIQGLIEPIRVATVPSEGDGEPPAAGAGGEVLDADRLRRVRALMAEEPLLAAAVLPGTGPGSTTATYAAAGGTLAPRRFASLWLPWVFLLIGVAVAIPVFWQLFRPTGAAREWPGVSAAHAAIAALPPQATVQVLWAYDPATAGELDLVAAPIVRHLLDKGATLQIVSLLPNGPATARRLIAAVHDERSQLRRGVGEAPLDPPRFLPGGVLVLPSVAEQTADLALVFGAEAEDVQAWLEQVAPRNRVPVVAATGAGADPLLRPYLASGQLVGLVSGYDGAAAYTALLDDPPTQGREQQMQVQLVGQNLATAVFLVLILAGNLAVLITGRRGDA
jgi:hypothetical protein